MASPFDTLLIANRGEIACRIIETARALGLRTVAVHSEADRSARHVTLADESVTIGPATARDSYLNIERVLQACRASGAQAVHPGYGFLSENADFARACAQAGLVFVGPPASAIDALGNKSAAKSLALRLGVPCLPGYNGPEQSDEALIERAREIGSPLMIKAAAGGGGRGMRHCDDVDDRDALRALLVSARLEAQASFGDGRLLLERRLDRARHVEVQVFGDQHGNYVHLGERDCSTQRRHQKILEEAPAPGVDAALRQRMGESAVRLAREVGYIGAGTVEFLLAPGGEYHFLEMNTRLQVEHPVTELIAGVDLVAWQLRIAQGESLPVTQEHLCLDGHAIEARLCAEDAFDGFVPQAGRIDGWALAPGLDVRVDHGLADAADVPAHYDSMIAKVIAWGSDRDEALRKLRAALQATTIAGVTSNRDYLLQCLRAPAFARAQLSTRWLADTAFTPCRPVVDARWIACAAALQAGRRAAPHGDLANWSSGTGLVRPLRLTADQATWTVWIEALDRNHYGIRVQTQDAERRFAIRTPEAPAGSPEPVPGLERRSRGLQDLALEVDGRTLRLRHVPMHDGGHLDLEGVCARYQDRSGAPPSRNTRESDGTVTARMHGQVAQIFVVTGQSVEVDQPLLSVEAMKMEHRIGAPLAGIVEQIAVQPGQQVAPGRLLIRLRAATAAATAADATPPGPMPEAQS